MEGAILVTSKGFSTLTLRGYDERTEDAIVGNNLLTAAVKKLDREIADLFFAYKGSHRFEAEMTIPTDETMNGWLRRVKTYADRVEQEDMHPFWRDHFSEVLTSLATQIEIDLDRPYKFINRLTSFIDYLSSADQRSLEERASLIMKKASYAPELLRIVLSRLGRKSAPTRREAADSSRVLTSGAQQAAQFWSGHGYDQVAQALEKVAQAAHSFSQQLPEQATGEVEPSLSYRRILENGYGLSLDWVHSWYQSALAREGEAMSHLAGMIDPKRSAPQILAEDLGAYLTPREMFQAMHEYVRQAQAASRRYVDLPEGERCTVEPMPELGKQTSPWGAYYGGDVLAQDLKGRVVLNDDNYEQVTRGWLEMMAIHECYPGHHTHRVKTAASRLPWTFKCDYLASAVITEGIAHRSETLLKDIFPEAAYPLFVQYRRVHTTARIKVDVELFINQKPLDNVYDIYCQEMGLDEKTARAQARAHLLLPGAHVTYYSGMQKLQELQCQLGWNDRRFTEAIFGHGFISAQTLNGLLQLDEAEREDIKAFTD